MTAYLLLRNVLQADVEALPHDCPLAQIPGFDSLKMVRLVLSLEEHLGRELSDSEFAGMVTFGDILNVLGTGPRDV
jgi:acyl carrier protein